MNARYANLRGRSLAVRGAILAAVVLAVFGVVGPVGWAISGVSGVLAAAVAAGLCLAGASAALVLSHWLCAPERVLYGVLAGMGARMVVPLAFGMAIHLHDGALARSHFLLYLVVFYPVTLAVETFLSLPKSNFTNMAGSTIDDVGTCRKTIQGPS